MPKNKTFDSEIIKEIVRLYSSGECQSKEKIGKKFNTSKKIISKILNDNNIETVSCGGRNKINSIVSGNKYETTDDYEFIAKHKITGKEFKDYNNVSGALIQYIGEVNPEIVIPSKYLRSSYYKRTGNYWYEQFFEIIKSPKIVKKKRGVLNGSDISEIVSLYSSGEVCSAHKLSEMFGVGHKKISIILKNNNVKINKKGGLKIYPDNVVDKYKVEDGFVYKAIHKETGAVLGDYNNISGALTRYISEKNSEIVVPVLESEKKRYLLKTGNYWYEEFFDIVKFDANSLSLRKCPYCGDYIDIDSSFVKYKNHLNKIHKINIGEHIKLHEVDREIFLLDVDRLEKEGNVDNWVNCKICGESLGIINSKHLKKHNLTVKEYKRLYGNNVSVNFLSDVTNRLKSYNELGMTKTYISKPELTIRTFLDEIGVSYETNRSVLIGKEIDILSHDYKLGIEFNGNKWHTEWFGKKDKNYHLDKTKACNAKGYGLIHIFEDELQYKKDIVFAKLKHIFNKDCDLEKIAARKCVIKQIDSESKKYFLEKFHIQGDGQSTVSIGSYHKDMLVAVMTFKAVNKKENKFELTRFASDYNYVHQGVGSKMMSYFIKTFKPDSIISFADRRWTVNETDNLYVKLGFKLVGKTLPDYRYYNEKVDRYKRFHKFGFRKNILNKKYGLDLSLTETEMVKLIGFDRIWDCGLFKYEWKK